MRLRRVGRVVMATAMALVVMAGCASEPAPESDRPVAPLRILVVNDDGWNAPGIVTLRSVLQRAGHRVVLVAPLRRNDVAGTAMTMDRDIALSRPVPRDQDLRAVAGTPADATLVALRAVMARELPDVVVSGINPGSTTGLSTVASGTVGAAMTAAATGVPAIAVSTDLRDPARPRPADFTRTADFVVRLLETLQRQRTTDALMPSGSVLNVNYPGGPETPGKVTVAPTAPVAQTSIVYRFGARPGTVRAVPNEQLPPGGDFDTNALRAGDVVLTDLSVDPDRSSPPDRTAARLGPELTP